MQPLLRQAEFDHLFPCCCISRSEEGLFSRLRCRVLVLNVYNFHVGFTYSPLYSYCQIPEVVGHCFLNCRRFFNIRCRLEHSFSLSGVPFTLENISSLGLSSAKSHIPYLRRAVFGFIHSSYRFVEAYAVRIGVRWPT